MPLLFVTVTGIGNEPLLRFICQNVFHRPLNSKVAVEHCVKSRGKSNGNTSNDFAHSGYIWCPNLKHTFPMVDSLFD